MTRLEFIFSEILIGLRRNVLMALSLVLVTTVSLVLVGGGILTQRQVETMKDYWYDRVQVSIFLCGNDSDTPSCADGEVSQAQKDQILADLKSPQLTPYVAQVPWREFAAEHGIVVEGYSPLWRGRELLDEPVVVEAARAHGKTPGQVVLRWHVQLGTVPVPQSADPRRQAENLEGFDFALTDDEMATLSALDRGDELATDPASFGH